jgi:ABC-type branched-subunit amino acid transport system substrate-binding protein
MFRDALQLAGSADREKLRDAFSRLKTREITSGIPVVFDRNGARKEYIYFMQIVSVDGKRTYKSKQIHYAEWDADVIPVYDLVK